MDTDSSSYYETTYSEDERIEMALRNQKRIDKERVAREDLAREQLFKKYSTKELPIFNLAGLEFHTIRPKKIKFSFHPATITSFVKENVRFYVSLKYVHKHWRVKRDSLPANYKLRIYNLFYDQKFFIVDDENIFSVIAKIYEILVSWAKNEEKFRLEKSEKYRNGEDVELDSDDEQLFLNQEERIRLYQKRVKILRRMIPPKKT